MEHLCNEDLEASKFVLSEGGTRTIQVGRDGWTAVLISAFCLCVSWC